MFRVTLWPQLLLVVLILRQSAAVSDHCSELQEEISRLERDVVSITELRQENELLASNCHEKLTNQILISQATSKELNKTVAVNNDLKKHLEVKDLVLKSINEKQTQLHTTIDDLTKSVNQAFQRLFEKQDQQQSSIDGVTKTVDSMNHTVQKLFVKQEQLEVREEVLKSINEKQTELQTTIDDLTKRVDTINQAVQILVEKQEQPQTTNDGLAKTVESLNQTSQLQCGTPKDVCRSLIDAAKSGHVDSVKRLVKCDSNDSCTDYDERRQPPLLYAAEHGHVEVVRVLLEGGANVDRANAYENTALYWAASFGRLDVCRLLLDWGAEMNRQDRWKDTPLISAAREGHLSVVKLLVERGADVSVKDESGRTASVVARIWEKNDVADWLDLVRRG